MFRETISLFYVPLLAVLAACDGMLVNHNAVKPLRDHA